MKFELVDELFGSHSGADTRVMMHAKHADQEFGGKVVLRANDIDILIIAATNMRHLVRSNLWMDIGHASDNSRCFIDIANVCNATKNVDALAPIYAFTGCDYSPSFHRKGKVKPMKLLEKNKKFIDVFSKFGVIDLTEENYATVEHFVRRKYGFGKQTDVNALENKLM